MSKSQVRATPTTAPAMAHGAAGAEDTPTGLALGLPPALDALPPLLTVEEVAATLRTSRKAVYAMAERGQLPGLTRLGRRLLVRRDDLLFWLDERRAASPGGTRR